MASRVIVFTEYRNSAKNISDHINRSVSRANSEIFVGQKATTEVYMNRKLQAETIEKFKQGVNNVIVATCVGEEGIDIGEVDLIILFDSTASGIRTI